MQSDGKHIETEAGEEIFVGEKIGQNQGAGRDVHEQHDEMDKPGRERQPLGRGDIDEHEQGGRRRQVATAPRKGRCVRSSSASRPAARPPRPSGPRESGGGKRAASALSAGMQVTVAIQAKKTRANEE